MVFQEEWGHESNSKLGGICTYVYDLLDMCIGMHRRGSYIFLWAQKCSKKGDRLRTQLAGCFTHMLILFLVHLVWQTCTTIIITQIKIYIKKKTHSCQDQQNADRQVDEYFSSFKLISVSHHSWVKYSSISLSPVTVAAKNVHIIVSSPSHLALMYVCVLCVCYCMCA